MIHGSVTSIGVVYAGPPDLAELAANLRAILGPVLGSEPAGHWLLRFVGGSARDVHVDIAFRADTDPREAGELMKRFVVSEQGELEARIELSGIGPVEAILRPEAAVGGFLVDIPDSILFPDRGPRRLEQVVSSIEAFLQSWHDTRPFAVAFADHEAEFEGDPLALESGSSPYALLALPEQVKGRASLRFHRAAWPLSPVGA